MHRTRNAAWVQAHRGFESPPLRQPSDLFADKALKRGDPSFIFLDQVGGLRIIVERALFIFADPDTDQVARDIVLLREAVQRLAGDELLEAV